MDLNDRIGEYIGISPLTKKQVKPKYSSVADHSLFCNHFVTSEHQCSRYWCCLIYFLLADEIEHYHCHKLWFAYCNTCKLIFSSLELENGLKKHVGNVTWIKYGFVELVLILFSFNTRSDVIPSDFAHATTST